MRSVDPFEEWYGDVAEGVTDRIIAAVGDPILGREASAEAFARCYEKWKRVSKMESPEGWVYTTGVNLCRRSWRRRGIERRALEKLKAEPTYLLLEDHDLDTSDISLEEVAGLPGQMRRAVELRYWEGLQEHEVAEEMGISTGAASATLSNARKRLREQIEQRALGAKELGQ